MIENHNTATPDINSDDLKSYREFIKSVRVSIQNTGSEPSEQFWHAAVLAELAILHKRITFAEFRELLTGAPEAAA